MLGEGEVEDSASYSEKREGARRKCLVLGEKTEGLYVCVCVCGVEESASCLGKDIHPPIPQ